MVPVGFTFDTEASARVITSDGSVKVRNAARPGARAAICQLEGRYWLTLEGPIRVSRDPDDVAAAVALYAQRYRQPKVNPSRVALIMAVDRIMGNI